MKVKLTIVVLCALSVAPLYGQRGRGGRGAPQAPATNTAATAIPGVVAAGTPITVIKEGFQGTEGPITLPDGSLIFSNPAANQISKIDKTATSPRSRKPTARTGWRLIRRDV